MEKAHPWRGSRYGSLACLFPKEADYARGGGISRVARFPKRCLEILGAEIETIGVGTDALGRYLHCSVYPIL